VAALKALALDWLPPAVVRWVRQKRGGGVVFRGDFATWEEASACATGYDAPEILAKVTDASRLVKKGDALFERDSVLFYEPQYPYPLIAGLLRVAALHQGRLSVLDFGGALGSTYNQCKLFFANLDEVKWCVVEQPQFVRKGREEFTGEVLTFADSIEGACLTNAPNVIIFSSVLQYICDPWAVLRQAGKLDVHSIIIDRTPVIFARHDKISMQIVPKGISPSNYPIRFFTRGSLLRPLAGEFQLMAEFDALDGTLGTPDRPVPFKGYILERFFGCA
jgi:putative methyltransferase (TIGR04325 family)